MRLKDKVAIVTGSGPGIGEGIVLRFAEEGAKIIVNDVNEDDAKNVVDQVKAKGGQAVAVIGSVSDRATVQKMVDTAVKEFGTLDIIVNNAGITRDSILHKMTDDQWSAVIDVNLTGVYLGIQCAARIMRSPLPDAWRSGRIWTRPSPMAMSPCPMIQRRKSRRSPVSPSVRKTAASPIRPALTFRASNAAPCRSASNPKGCRKVRS